MPHEKQGFPNLDRAAYGLRRLPILETLGWIWVVPDPASDVDLEAFLSLIDSELD